MKVFNYFQFSNVQVLYLIQDKQIPRQDITSGKYLKCFV